MEFVGQEWLQYDQTFCMRSTIQPNMCQDEPLPGLWPQDMTLARPNTGDRFDSGHLNRKVATNQIPRPGVGQVVQPRMHCY